MLAANAAPSEGIHFPWCRKKQCKSNSQTEPDTASWLICHSLLNLPEIYCQLDSISLCLLIWLKGWFIKAQHHIELCSLLRRVMSCRHISFSFPTWLWGCRRRWESAGFGVTHRQLCWLPHQPAPSPSCRTGCAVFVGRIQGPAQRHTRSSCRREGVEWEITEGRTMAVVRK